MLGEKESYGYELLEQINDASSFGSAVDPGAVYRTLRQMENEGLVKSKWDTKSAGPARRIYRITKDGEERLYSWIVSLKQRKTAIEKLLKVYERR
jgi:poly-beta-hydroxybutyrate-responsive repressor